MARVVASSKSIPWRMKRRIDIGRQDSGGILVPATAVFRIAQLMLFTICPIPQIKPGVSLQNEPLQKGHPQVPKGTSGDGKGQYRPGIRTVPDLKKERSRNVGA